MRSRLLFAGLLLGLIGVAVWLARQPTAVEKIGRGAHAITQAPPSTSAPEQPPGEPPPATAPLPVEPVPVARPPSAELQRLTYASGVAAQVPAEIAAFRRWLETYRAGDAAARAGLESAGLALARTRRPVMRALIERDPQAALALTVPAGLRGLLPAAIAAELESRFSANGNFTVYAFDFSADEIARRRRLGLTTDPFQFTVELGGRTYRAFIYGRRVGQTSKERIPLHGVRLDDVVALHEGALRVLEPDEVVAGGAGVWPAELAGRIQEFNSPDDLLAAEARLEAVERPLGPVTGFIPPDDGRFIFPKASVGIASAVAAAPPTGWTVGPKQLLVIRVDFSDLPGDPRGGAGTYTADYVKSLADTQVAPYYAQSSYGQTSLTTTVSTKVYRMPQTAAQYAVAGANDQLHTDARTAAAADYNVNSFDRIMLLFSNLGGIAGSQITYGGLGQVGNKNTWINGEFDFRVVAHELGHNWGLLHANLWQVSDGNAVSSTGSSIEYGDNYDTMGANFANDQRTDFNPWFKNLLGWAADSQVLSITSSGTYRVNRFDNSTGTGTLGLKVRRDATRNTWVGVRRAFTTNASMQHGAYLIWGYNTNHQSDLLDTTTPGSSVNDAALGVGATLIDTTGNLLVRTIAEGGTAPNEFLDVQVTVGLNGIPVFDVQPQSQSFAPGSTVSLSVSVSGNPTPTYQWRKNDVDLAGATNTTFTIVNAQPADGGTYTVRATNSIASVLSNPAVISVNAAPTITIPPVHVVAAVGQAATLSVTARGSPAPTYQWRHADTGVNVPGATNATLTFSSIQSSDAGNYDVVVQNAFGAPVGGPVQVIVNAAGTPPSNDNFSAAWVLPGNFGAAFGSNVGATGETGEPVHTNTNVTATSVWYRWTPSVSGTAQIDTIGSNFDTVLAVYTGSALTSLTLVGTDDQSGGLNTSKLIMPVVAGTTYQIVVGDWSSARQGGTIALHYGVYTKPAITTQPTDQVSTVGGSAAFSVVASGVATSYQWFHLGVPVPGGTDANLYLGNLQSSDGGSYYVAISNLAGAVLSNSVSLTSAGSAPTITTPPGNTQVTAGQTANLVVAATGSALAYQWRRNGFILPGATGQMLTLPAVSRADADYYDVIVGSGLMTTVSPAARLSVAPTSYPALISPDPAWDLQPESAGGNGLAVLPLSDGRAYIAGTFTSADGVHRANVARLNADGTIDSTFVPPEIDNSVRCMALQSDGKLVLGGDFVRVNKQARNRLVRLDSAGAIDATFNPGSGVNNTVSAIVVQPNGKIVVGGSFTGFAGTLRNFVARLNADGSVDSGWLNRGVTNTVNALALQGDGKLLVGGTFTSGFVDNNGNIVTRSRLARLNDDGTLDSFNPAPNGTISALLLQPDGKLLVGGTFTLILGVNVSNAARLNSDGSSDASFNTTLAAGFNGSVLAFAVQSDNRILVGGSFTTVNGVTQNRFARLESTGARDTTLQTLGFSSTVNAVGVLPSGRLIAAGGYSSYLNLSNIASTRLRFARLNSDGSLDTAMNFALRTPGSINGIVRQADGKVIVTGFFTTLRGNAVPLGVARLLPTGAVDAAYNAGGSGSNSNVYSAVLQPDGKLIISGFFTTYNGTAANNLARLNPDGTLDASFNAGSGLGGNAGYTLSLLPGGRLFVGGFFTTAGGVSRSGVAVFLPNGSLDPSFDPGSGADSTVYSSAVQSDGRIVIGGAFSVYKGASAPRIARLNVDGSLDTTFTPGTGASSSVTSVAVQPDGRIVIGGFFTIYNSVTRTGVARLSSTGALDMTFVPPALSLVYSVLAQEDGKVLARGTFPTAGAGATEFLARLNTDGTRDTSFGVGGFGQSNSIPSTLVMGDAGQMFTQSSGNAAFAASMASTVPAITTPPASNVVAVGGTISLSVVAGGDLPVTYQWSLNNTAINGATSSTLTITNAQAANGGDYRVTLTNELGSVTSNPATITIGVTGGLLVGSVRANSGAGVAAMQGAFTIEAPTAKQMLLRAIGPTLSTFGVSGVLADPRLTIFNATTGATVAANDDWGSAANAAQVPAVTNLVGAFALPSGSRDAVVLANFATGTYRLQVAGATTASGNVMLEKYDADTTARVVHLATRGQAGQGNAVFLEGVVLGTPVAGRSYLIRALGPSLGIPGALADPQLTVFSNGGSTIVASNDDWGGAAALVTLASAAGATPLPAASKDSAVAFTPTAGGTYTLQVAGANNTTGITLVEVFEVDGARASTMPAAIVSAPEPITVGAGLPATFGVVAVGKPLTFQWRKAGTSIAGATNAQFTLASAQVSDGGSYDVVVSDGTTPVTSAAVALTILTNAGNHANVAAGYVAGHAATITNTFTYAGAPTGVAWNVTLPAGWSFASDTSTGTATKPLAGATGSLRWDWTTVPANPITFTYTLNVPAGETLDRTLSATEDVRNGTATQTVTATPNPLTLKAVLPHSADSNGDLRIDLNELTRIIALYNTRNGGLRTGCYLVQAGTEDGFAPDPARANGAVVTLTKYHSADTQGAAGGGPDGKIGLTELTRVIELYNTRSGTVRTGAYHPQAGTEDGFAGGP